MEASEMKEQVFRSEESIQATREAHIDYLLDAKSVKDWDTDKARRARSSS